MNNSPAKNAVCYIVGAGPLADEKIAPEEGDYVIAADGGYIHLKKRGIEPDMLLGDFDSLDEPPNHPNTVRHNPIKDDTDMMLAIKTALSMGYCRFYIFGGLGGRIDHTLANIQILAFLANKGAQGFLIGKGEVITAIKNSKIRFHASCSGYVSVFCHGDRAEGVYESGLKYSLTDAVLTNDMPLGVSNEFAGSESEISVADGLLIITWQGNVYSLFTDN